MRIVGLEKEQIKDKNLYYQCGSRKLCHWLITHKQIFPITSYIHSNGKLISIFVMNEELSQCLTEWTSQKPTNISNIQTLQGKEE